MKIIDRLLKIDLPPAQSAFLWGPRKTGKTTYQQKNSRKAWYMIFSKQTCLLNYRSMSPISQNRISAAVLGYLVI